MSSIFQPQSAEEIKKEKEKRRMINAGEFKRQKQFWKYLNRIGDNSSRIRDNSDLFCPKEYLRGHFRTQGQKMDLEMALRQPSLYYPGAGADFGPFKLFSRYSVISTVIYCDYLYGECIGAKAEKDRTARIREELKEFKVINDGEFLPASFGQKSWADFWPADPDSRSYASPRESFGAWALLCFCPKDSEVIKMINFIYLCTEATQTYDVLFAKRRIKPTVVVIQDHGLGGGWTAFGGKSKLHHIAKSALPELLYLSDDTKVWPGYKRVSDYGEMEGMHGNKRALYSLNNITSARRKMERSRR